MKFIDEAKIFVSGGRGGDGCMSFRREKYVPRGGPDGGNGGEGGSIILQVDLGCNTLMDLKGKRHFRAEAGTAGRSKAMHGRCGRDEIIRVPPGTLVKDTTTQKILADLVNPQESFIAAKGGRGGRGNLSFVSSTNRAPRQFQPGQAGEERELLLELKLLADVGLLGLPNAGKSTLISKISAARPKIADYPFTTLKPQLGVVSTGYDQTFTVADIPGLIQGAHQGSGMGTQFLRHVERTKLLLHLIDIAQPDQKDPLEAFQMINHELKLYAEALAKRTQWIILSKADLLNDTQQLENIKQSFMQQGYPVLIISAVTGLGLKELMQKISVYLKDLT